MLQCKYKISFTKIQYILFRNGGFNMNNLKIRKAIAKNRLKYYEVAAACGISSSTFSVWLREELSPEREDLIMKAIKDLIEKEA